MKLLLFVSLAFAAGKSMTSYDSVIAYEKNKPLQFQDFELTYAGQEDQSPPGPTLTAIVHKFSVKAAGQPLLNVEIVYGQTPPGPAEFTVGKSKFKLFTFMTPKGERLNPNQLLVQKVR